MDKIKHNGAQYYYMNMSNKFYIDNKKTAWIKYMHAGHPILQ